MEKKNNIFISYRNLGERSLTKSMPHNVFSTGMLLTVEKGPLLGDHRLHIILKPDSFCTASDKLKTSKGSQ